MKIFFFFSFVENKFHVPGRTQPKQCQRIHSRSKDVQEAPQNRGGRWNMFMMLSPFHKSNNRHLLSDMLINKLNTFASLTSFFFFLNSISWETIKPQVCNSNWPLLLLLYVVWTFSLRHHAQQNINRKIQSSRTLTQIRNLSWWELTDSPSTSVTLWMCYLGNYLAVCQWTLKMIEFLLGYKKLFEQYFTQVLKIL